MSTPGREGPRAHDALAVTRGEGRVQVDSDAGDAEILRGATH